MPVSIDKNGDPDDSSYVHRTQDELLTAARGDHYVEYEKLRPANM